MRVSVRPVERDRPLVVDPETISQRLITFQLLKPVAMWEAQFLKLLDGIDLQKLAQGSLLNVRRQLAAG